jgi:hypothetical protein
LLTSVNFVKQYKLTGMEVGLFAVPFAALLQAVVDIRPTFSQLLTEALTTLSSG